MPRSQAKFEGCAAPNSARRWCSATRCLFSILMSPPPRNSCLGGVRPCAHAPHRTATGTAAHRSAVVRRHMGSARLIWMRVASRPPGKKHQHLLRTAARCDRARKSDSSLSQILICRYTWAYFSNLKKNMCVCIIKTYILPVVCFIACAEL